MPDTNNDFVKFSDVYDGETLAAKNLNLGVARGELLTMLGPPAPARRRPS